LRTGTMRIPMFLHLPRQKSGKRWRPIVQPWDITPTVLELFGLPAPPELQGESLLPLTRGRKRKPRPYAFNASSLQGGGLLQAINANWIYTCWPTGVAETSLIDLKSNPGQDKNVIKKRPDVAKRMHAALERFDPAATGQGGQAKSAAARGAR
jgi:arylsulfatase A-like enzyme